jgi:hypothetical protein
MKPEATKTLRGIARELDAENPNDFRLAKQKMVELLAADDFSLLWELRQEVAANVAEHFISDIRHDRMTAVKGRIPETKISGSEPSAIMQAAEMVRGFIASWPIRINMKSLATCTGVDLDEQIEVEMKLEKGHSRNRIFYTMLRKRVGDTQEVGTAVSDKDARELWDRVRGISRETKNARKYRKVG